MDAVERLTRRLVAQLRSHSIFEGRDSVGHDVDPLKMRTRLSSGRIWLGHADKSRRSRAAVCYTTSIWVHWYNRAAGTMRITISHQPIGSAKALPTAEVSLMPSELEAWIDPLALLLVILARGGRPYEWTSAALNRHDGHVDPGQTARKSR